MTLLHTKYACFGFCSFREEDFIMYFHYMPMEVVDAPGAGPVWTPGALLAGFIKRTTIHCYRQNMISIGLVVSKKRISFMFSHYKSMGANDPRGGAIFYPRGMLRRIYVKLYMTMLHVK